MKTRSLSCTQLCSWVVKWWCSTQYKCVEWGDEWQNSIALWRKWKIFLLWLGTKKRDAQQECAHPSTSSFIHLPNVHCMPATLPGLDSLSTVQQTRVLSAKRAGGQARVITSVTMCWRKGVLPKWREQTPDLLIQEWFTYSFMHSFLKSIFIMVNSAKDYGKTGSVINSINNSYLLFILYTNSIVFSALYLFADSLHTRRNPVCFS